MAANKHRFARGQASQELYGVSDESLFFEHTGMRSP